jgi:hypothetical protein
MAYNRLPVSDLPNVDFPPPVTATLSGPTRKPWPRRGHAPGKGILDHRRHRLMTSSTARLIQYHPAVPPWTGTSTPRPRRPGGHHRRLAPAAHGHAHPADLPQGQPGRPAHPESGHLLAHAQLSDVTNTPRRSWPSASPWSRRVAQSCLRSRKYAVRVQIDPEPWPPGRSGGRVNSAIKSATSTCPWDRGRSGARIHRAVQRKLMNAEAYGPLWWP